VFTVYAADKLGNKFDYQEEASIYHDAMFSFDYKKIGTHNYTAKVTRKNNVFDKFAVKFIYQIIVLNGDHSDRLITKYVFLHPGEKSAEVKETITGEILDLNDANYGIKFPILDYKNTDIKSMDIRDAVYNLKLEYYSGWYTYYIFTNRQLQALDSPVTLKRCLNLQTEVGPQSVWETFVLEKGSWKKYDYVTWENKITGYQTNPDEYYLQFQ
jgi:hypothetical protein